MEHLSMQKLKTCSACKADKPASDFYRLKTVKSGLAAQCKQCKLAIANVWKRENKERLCVTNKAWRDENLEKARASTRAWYVANPDAHKIKQSTRRARKRAVGGVLSKGLAAKLFKLQRGLCPCCALALGEDYHLDHIMPLALGGSNTDDNMQLLRAICNGKKHAKHPVSFMQSKGFLL